MVETPVVVHVYMWSRVSKEAKIVKGITRALKGLEYLHTLLR